MSRYLRHIRIGRYGAFEDYAVGPFGPGLNVVYGPNEAGKSTIASFVGGVLFGWEEAKGVRNTYRPAAGTRAGSLVFADGDGGPDAVVSRELNSDGLQGDSRVVDDIDNATFRSMFSLSSDELRALRNTSDVTARLLTAGSGTGSSPSAAFVEIEQRIAALTSRAPDAEGSIVDLSQRIEAKREEVRVARESNDLLKLQDRERDELAQSRIAASQRLSELNAEVEGLKALRARVDSIDVQIERARVERADVLAEREEFASGLPDGADVDQKLVDLDTSAERALRDRLEEFSAEEEKVARNVDIAKENSAASAAAYDALLEMRGEGEAAMSSTRVLQTLVSIALPVLFVVFGAATFLHGRSINSLSFTALGVGLVVLAFLLAVGAIAVLVRPNRSEEAAENRRKDAQWVMLQDRKKLEGSLAAKDALAAEIAAYFDAQGLAAANGSVKQARALLDDARELRAERTSANQRIASFDMRLSRLDESLQALEAERAALLDGAEIPRSSTRAEIEARIVDAEERRDAHAQAYDEMNRRYGELSQLLDQARGDTSFDALKLEAHAMACKLHEAEEQLVTLILAKRMIEKAISAWESRSRPEVYAQASRLFSLITGGAWAQVAMTADGRLVAVSPDGDSRDVRHLSLGTCQQLYLSLRVAMLLHAASVGRCIPVLADDILVHFDAERRLAAARVIAELAAHRQVIVFTCHEQTVDALRGAVADLNYIEL